MKRTRLRWRRVVPGELETVAARLANWASPAGGAQRHMFALSAIESFGAEAVRLAADDERWAAAVVFPGRLVVPCGDAEAITAAGLPTRRWRLLVADVAAGDALLSGLGEDPQLVVHDQRFLLVDPDRVPSPREVPDPGLRRAEPADLPKLAALAVRLHVDDRFGPDPGRAGERGYRQRLEQTVRQGLVSCVGPVGDPVFKLERSVSSRRWGVQLAGIVADPEVRGQGLGRAAVAAAVRTAIAEGPRTRPISLHVRADNHPALAAYAAAGFVDREAWRLAVRT
ncbi:GNAT family N-acetyltransferase [Nitriliruptor alkaliphilus]|uniref:GNAT family N-acetyltransferase n=1 Tax=Nitriliruptor alkaliphilus TaxID=427918 RepID=UPI000696FF79|nr:GNAT family N-acetyltransferase [Nitriliruptor alkaliphilus]